MIDFKYHVVSIVAVFLALAVGIVLGTNVLSGDVLSNLKSQTNDLRKEAQDLRAQNQQQQDQLSNDQNFAQAIEPTVVAGKLTGERVVVISVPDAPKSVRDAAVKTLNYAGATVTAQVDIASNYDDPKQAATLDELLKTLGTPAFDPTAAGDVPARAAAILASALVGSNTASTSPTLDGTPPASPPASASKSGSAAKSSGEPAASGSPASVSDAAVTVTDSPAAGDPRPMDTASTEVLAGLTKAGFLKFDQQPTEFADLAVVVTAAAPAKQPTASPAPDTSLLDLIAALQRDGSRTVVVGPVGSADAGGLVAQVRSDSSLSKVISAVDDADLASGRIAMVLALTSGAAGTAGQYGSGQGAQALLPTAGLGPTPTPPLPPSLSSP
jgi:hypothetical protein